MTAPTFVRQQPPPSPEDRLRLFAHALAVLPTEIATRYAGEVLDQCPLYVAVGRCTNGGLRDADWMPLRLAARDATQWLVDPRAWVAANQPDSLTNATAPFWIAAGRGF